MSSLIDGYIGNIEWHLRFDRKLAQRAREDVEGHLYETLERQGISGPDAEARIIAGFGDAKNVALKYCDAVLPHRLKTTWMTTAGLVIATLIFMRLRTMSLGLAQADISPILMWIDRIGFAMGFVCGLVAWILLPHTKTPHDLQRIQLILGVSMLTLAMSIAANLSRAVAAMQVAATPQTALLVIISGVVELALLAWVASRIRSIGRYGASEGQSHWLFAPQHRQFPG